MIEHIILANLIENEEYSRQTLPFIKEQYFKSEPDKLTFQLADDYIRKYNALPTKEALYIELQNKTGISQDTFEKTTELIFGLNADVNTKLEWLVEQSEKFCQDAEVYNAVFEDHAASSDNGVKIEDITMDGGGLIDYPFVIS